MKIVANREAKYELSSFFFLLITRLNVYLKQKHIHLVTQKVTSLIHKRKQERKEERNIKEK